VRLLILGGKLQGTEAAYLARKAGWETLLVDRHEAPPAAGLADTHVIADVTADEARARSLVTACDAVLPACEDEPTLAWLAERVPGWGVPLLFDLDAYRVSASKLASRRLFAEFGVPSPGEWPECGFPAVVKPSTASGSEGVVVVHDEPELLAARRRLERAGHEVVVEEYVAGPSLSLEVLAWGGRAAPLQATGLEFDAAYDCKRVVAPVGEAAAGASAAPGPGGACAWEAAVAPGVLDALDVAGDMFDLVDELGLDRVHQPTEHLRGRLLEDDEDDRRDEQAHERVGEGEARGDAEGPEHDGQRGQPVGAGVVAIGHEGGRADVPPDPEAVEGHELVTGEADDARHDDGGDVRHRLWRHEPIDRFPACEDG